MLVDIATARLHLRVDGTQDDALIALWLGAAGEAAMQHLNRNVYADSATLAAAVLDGTAGSDPMVVNDMIKAAVLLTLGHLYANRESVNTGSTATELPRGVDDLLQPFRVGMGM
ncbi:hypothetical protein RCH06_001859 [Polaromonas sp. CG_9.5]|uniref:head-tail connector protein n=1 Tax=Polaromonas sp. CG_9.5 TaxID=3071705 RepID=UPI002E02BA45|nr:hypothetical protein [Polaromonas sp. CG_9.5]